MAYKPIHAWKRKDKLPSKDPQKIIYGSQLQDEFDAISDNLDLLAQIDIDGDGNINIPPELIDGLVDLLGDKADKVDLEAEIAARIAGDQALQKQIDELDTGGGGGASSWDELTGKPTEFPPEAHTHEQSEIDGLEDRLTSIEGSISDGGGFVDAPNDGRLYGRQSEAWAEVVIPEAVNLIGMIYRTSQPNTLRQATTMMAFISLLATISRAMRQMTERSTPARIKAG